MQPRRCFDDEDLEALADSISTNGILQPLLVRPATGEPGRFEIIAGERRWRAAQRAGLHEMPVVERSLFASVSPVGPPVRSIPLFA